MLHPAPGGLALCYAPLMAEQPVGDSASTLTDQATVA